MASAVVRNDDAARAMVDGQRGVCAAENPFQEYGRFRDIADPANDVPRQARAASAGAADLYRLLCVIPWRHGVVDYSPELQGTKGFEERHDTGIDHAVDQAVAAGH